MPSLSLTSTMPRPDPRNADRNPTSRSPSPRNTVRLSVISTSDGAAPSHWSIRYAAVTPAPWLSMPTYPHRALVGMSVA